jgi:DNA-binding GntR family transcriptional regulator
MRDDLQQNRLTEANLRDMRETDLAKRYDASRDTVRKARNQVLLEISEGRPKSNT